MKKTCGVILVMMVLLAVTAAAQIDALSARQIALEHAGLDEAQVTWIEEETDTEAGRAVREVKFAALQSEFSYEIAADTGEILSFDGDAHRYAPLEGELTIEEALEIALQKAAVAHQDAQVVKAKLDMDEGARHYEIEFTAGGFEYECEIDTVTGQVLDWDTDAQ